MKVKTADWNKLVRDKIPEIIRAEGGVADTYIVSDNQIYREVLLSKLEEEALEAGSAENEHLLEELGDIETVIDAILELKGWTREELKVQQDKKDEERGKFNKRIILKSTIRSAE